MRLPGSKKQKSEKVSKKEPLKYRIIRAAAYLICASIVFSIFWAIMTHEKQVDIRKKKEIVQRCYETMYIANGYTLSYTIECSYLVKYSNGTAGTVSMAYQAQEEIDQYNQKKKITLISVGRVMDSDIYNHQVLYYEGGNLITEEYDDVGELVSSKTEPMEISFDYNPMLTFASMVLDKPGEFRLKNEGKTIKGSISLKDISSFLNLFPYSALFSGVENNKYYTDEVNSITITNNNGFFTSAVINLKNIAASLVGPFYSEAGAAVEVNQYTITLNMVSWETPTIEIPKGE